MLTLLCVLLTLWVRCTCRALFASIAATGQRAHLLSWRQCGRFDSTMRAVSMQCVTYGSPVLRTCQSGQRADNTRALHVCCANSCIKPTKET